MARLLSLRSPVATHKKWILKNLMRGPSFLSRNFEHELKSLKSLISDVAKILLQVLLRVVLKDDLPLLSKPVSLSPLVLFRCTQHPKDFVYLIKFASPGKKWLLQIQFRHHTADCEDVRNKVVVMRPQNALWCSVPPCTHI